VGPPGDRGTAAHAAGFLAVTRWRRREGPLSSMRWARCRMRSRVASATVGSPITFVPSVDRDLAGDQQRSSVVAIVNDLEQIMTLFGIDRLWPQSAPALRSGSTSQTPPQPLVLFSGSSSLRCAIRTWLH
jgi:hypothetical protein